jgi:hypothetical protein
MNDEDRTVDFESLEPPLEAAVKAALKEPIPEDAIERVKVRARLLATTAVLPSAGPAASLALPGRWPTRSWLMRHPISGLAAAVAFAAAIAGVVLWFHGSGATLAVADFMQPILQAKTLKYKTIIEMKGPPATTIRGEDMVLDATRSRQETGTSNESKTVTITDWGRGKILTLFPAAKQARVVKYSDTKNWRNDLNLWFRLLQTARDNQNKKFFSERLGEKEIDGRRVVGFRVHNGPGPALDLWGDPTSGMPVQVEMVMGVDRNTKMTLTDFVFNVPMDESLFSVEPPPGYTVRTEKANQRTEKANLSPEKERDLLEMFRVYTKLTGGDFPESLDLLTAWWAYCKKHQIQAMWDNVAGASPLRDTGPAAAATQKTNEAERRKFEERMGSIMDKIQDETIAGRTNAEQMRKLTEEMTKITMPLTSRRRWENVAPPSWKGDETRRRKFEEQTLKLANGTPEENRKAQHEINKLAVAKMWEEQAPPDLQADEAKRHKFEELMLWAIEPQPGDTKKLNEDVRQVLGDRMVKSMEAWAAKMRKATNNQKSQQRKTVEIQKAKSREFTEAQVQIQRGISFANHLPPSAGAHYAGKGVRLGAADTPVFWYRPAGTGKYHVIYADLSVRDADAPPQTPKATPGSAPARAKK